jgi:hypothetical protein
VDTLRWGILSRPHRAYADLLADPEVDAVYIEAIVVAAAGREALASRVGAAPGA